MTIKQPLFRGEALDRLISPDQLDRLIRITTLQSWLILAAFGSVIFMFAAWSIFGEIVSTVEQNGLLSLANQIQFIASPQSGRVEDIFVQPDDRIQIGQILASITITSATGEEQIEEVISPIDGRVISLRVAAGSPVSTGTPLFSIEDYTTPSDELMAITYLSLEQVQQIEPGMEVSLRPIAADTHSEGYLLGTVASIAAFPATQSEIITVLGSGNSLSSSTALLFEVRIMPLRVDNQYVWSIASDSGFELISGMAVQIIIETRTERPINRILEVF